MGISPKLRVGTIKAPSAITAAEHKLGDLLSVTESLIAIKEKKKEKSPFPEPELQNPTQHRVNCSLSPLTLLLVRQSTRDMKPK